MHRILRKAALTALLAAYYGMYASSAQAQDIYVTTVTHCNGAQCVQTTTVYTMWMGEIRILSTTSKVYPNPRQNEK